MRRGRHGAGGGRLPGDQRRGPELLKTVVNLMESGSLTDGVGARLG